MAPFQVSATPPLSVLLNPVAWLLWILDFLVWVLTLIGPAKFFAGFCQRRESVKVGDAWRLVDAEDALMKYNYDEDSGAPLKTVHDIIQRSFTKFADRPAAGTRTYLGEHKPEGAKFPLMKFGETKWVSYGEFGCRVKNFGAGLIKLGLKPTPEGVDLQKVGGPHSILIFEETCADWTLACVGSFSQSIAVATSYATLGISSVADALNETGATAIVCNIKDVSKIASFCDGKCPSLQVIIYTTNKSLETTPQEPSSKYTTLSVDEVLDMGAKNPVKFSPPKPDHLAVIMYTSGSTGKPKGVMIKHSNFVASIAGLRQKFAAFGLLDGQESYIAYLPAAHILELVAEMSCLSMGTAIGFACPKTISSKGACRVMPNGEINTTPGYPYPPGGIQEFRPSLMAAVPKIWDILKKGVEDVVGKGSPVKQFLFQVAYTGRYWALCQGRESPLFKAIIFSKLSAMLGGQLKCGISGGGPISADVQNFIRTAFATPLLQGYALTETTSAGTVQSFSDVRPGVVGPPLGCVELKLRSCLGKDGAPEVMDRRMSPYLIGDTEHYGTPCLGRGEVLIRGPSVASGYFKQPEKTAEVFAEDGWFHTGDVGLWTPDGALMVIDRVKNLVKLKGGEYIAIEAMEKEYSTSVYVNGVAGGLMCYGDGDMDRPIAFVQANTVELEKWAKSAGVSYSSVEGLCSDPVAEKMVLDTLLAAGKKGDLGANEYLQGIALIPGTGSEEELTATSPWTPQNGGLTASNKLSRKPIQMALESTIFGKLKKTAIR